MAFGGLDTLTKSIASPPTVTLRSGLRGVIVEALRRLLHLLHHEGAIHAHALRVHVDVAAGVLQDLQRFLVQEEDADLLEDAHRAVVDALDALLVERLDRPVAVLRDRPRHLMDGGGAGAADDCRRGRRSDARAAVAALQPASSISRRSSCARLLSRAGENSLRGAAIEPRAACAIPNPNPPRGSDLIATSANPSTTGRIQYRRESQSEVWRRAQMHDRLRFKGAGWRGNVRDAPASAPLRPSVAAEQDRETRDVIIA